MEPYSAAHPQYLFLPEYPLRGCKHLAETLLPKGDINRLRMAIVETNS